MTQQQQSRKFDVSDLSSIPWLGKRKEFVAISGPEETPRDVINDRSLMLVTLNRKDLSLLISDSVSISPGIFMRVTCNHLSFPAYFVE